MNRAPVLTVWAVVVAERLGFERGEALTLGRSLAGLTAHAKGVRLGIFEPSAPEEVRERRQSVGTPAFHRDLNLPSESFIAAAVSRIQDARISGTRVQVALSPNPGLLCCIAAQPPA